MAVIRDRFMLSSKGSHCNDQQKSGIVDNSKGVGRKRQMSSTTDIHRTGTLSEHRDRESGNYGFQGTVTVGGGSE